MSDIDTNEPLNIGKWYSGIYLRAERMLVNLLYVILCVIKHDAVLAFKRH